MTEDYGDWAHRQRVQQDRWDYANNTGPYAPKPESPPTWTPPASIDFGRAGESFGPSSGYGYHAGGSSSSLGCLPLFVLIPSIAAWPLLYPAPVLGAIVLSGVGYGILEAAFDVYTRQGRLGLTIAGAVVGLVALVWLSRLDHRLARSMIWRVPRHLLRLGVIVAVAHQIAIARLFPGSAGNGPIPGTALLRNPLYLAALAVLVIMAHYVITRPRLRDWWHERLEAVKLRPRFSSDGKT